MENTIKLTEYSHGGGCGCKIAPSVLEQILKSNISAPNNNKLLVGNSSKDDAAAYDIGHGMALISTTDFFMPIVNDPYNFGRIAAANAISDVYAMGGKPVLAIAILGWPVNKLPPEVAQKVLEGGRAICTQAGIPLAGGHSIDSPEPIFGLAVNGLVEIKNLKQNNTAQEGDLLLLTKPLGTGLLSTAQKRGHLTPNHEALLIKQLTTLNSLGELLGAVPGVHAMTDVTGFGLLGHCIEMAEGSGLSATLKYSKIPLMEGVHNYLALKTVPDATSRNWSSYGAKVGFASGVNVMEAFNLLPDPQTNGGLLIAVAPNALNELTSIFKAHGLEQFCTPIGILQAKNDKVVTIDN
jgi:selenide, water dikinase